jgi:hypothetical protein
VQSYRFEIVRRKRRRYGWRLVATKGDRRRVIARSQRSYRSPKRAKRAVEAVQCAEVVSARVTRDRDGIALPATSFRIFTDVVPLIMSGHGDDGDEAVTGKAGARGAGGTYKAA